MSYHGRIMNLRFVEPRHWDVPDWIKARKCGHHDARYAAAEIGAEADALVEELAQALTDMNNGWKYIRQSHGDLYGVGWDRAQDKADAALQKYAAAKGAK